MDSDVVLNPFRSTSLLRRKQHVIDLTNAAKMIYEAIRAGVLHRCAATPALRRVPLYDARKDRRVNQNTVMAICHAD